MKKYKYTRKECNKEIETIKRIFSGSQIMPGGWLETVTQYLHATQLMLLAQKEDKKECKHKLGDKEEHDNLGTYHIAGDTCVKCGKHIMDWDNPTPSPQEESKDIEKIAEEQFRGFYQTDSKNIYDLWQKQCEVIDTINSLTKRNIK